MEPEREQGVLIWERVPRGWRVAYSFRPRNFDVNATTGDVNGDRHADVLIADVTTGSGGCASWTLAATEHGRVYELFRVPLCDGAAIEHGGLVVDHPIAPCAIHCYRGTVRTYRRWHGTKLVKITREVICD